VCQKTESTYDGHGRLKTTHKPEQQADTANNPASTDHDTWDYNADDTIQKITDPRGAVSTFSYDGRHHVTNIAYSLLSGVPTTGPFGVASAATVSYQYDAAGNRKQMTDGMGTVTYTYDQLSRLTNETRFFSNLSGSATGGNYALSYEYNLVNQVTKLTDPNNLQLNYGYDSMGRLSGLTGVGFSVSTFLSNIQYRAWGATKSVAHVNGRTTEATYDARLRVATYKLLQIVPDDSIRLHNQYDYFPDGRLKKLTDLDDHDPSIIGVTDTGRWFTRVYRYDSRGRIMRARGYNQPNNFEFDRPFDLSYGYDQFNHLTSRSGKYYYQSPSFFDSATFLNNRRTGWTYGADGQETHSTGIGIVRDHTYNAAGKMVQVKETVTATSQISTYVTSYDGDGEQVREFVQENLANSDSYKIRSTVLGIIVTRLNNAGNKTGTTIPLDQRVTPARMTSADTGGVPFPMYEDPLHQSIAGDRKSVYDPLGNLVPWRPSPTGGPPPNYPRSSASFGGLGSLFGNAQESSCQLDGIPTNCDLAMRLQNNGSAMQCPYNDCGPQRRDFVNPDGERFSFLTLPFMAFGDGTFGYFLGGWAELGTPQEQAEILKAETVGGIDGGRRPGNSFLPPQEPRPAKTPTPQPTPTPEPQNKKLPDCVKKFLAQFAYFDQVVDSITFSTNGIPWYVPMDARAFTLGDHIYFAKDQFDPSNGVSDEEMILLAHETRHVNQYRWAGKKTFAKDYLWESAKRGLEGYYLGGTYLAFELSYWGNEYEADARSDADFIKREIERNGNPCR
jgi:YD repeat-containing protein